MLAHILGKPYEQIIAEFLGVYQSPGVSYSGSSDEGWTGDVKYHLGARRAFQGGEEVSVEVYLAPNPSHLEWVNPVVEGMTRACGEKRDRPGVPEQDERISLAVLIHGDASFPAQGIVAETLNLYRLPGFRTGGTIHLIANNQIGFTTLPQNGRSTNYASDLARGFDLPVIHVNADDPEEVNHRPPAGGSPTHRCNAHHLQRGGYERGHGTACKVEGTDPTAVRDKSWFHALLCEGGDRCFTRVPPAERGTAGRGASPQALLRHRHRDWRPGGAGSARSARCR